MRIHIVLLGVLFCASFGVAAGAGRTALEQDGVRFTVTPRSPDQVAAFYAGRGFPEAAVERLAAVCLVTIAIRNGRRDVVWLEPRRWRFVEATGRRLRRLDRRYWEAVWDDLGIPPANRATFRWTQLPESRDLRPDEPVGGNVALERPSGPFLLEARFQTGADRRGKEITIQVPEVRCPPSEAGTGGR